ncbi:MAG: biopolymer transporter ExbD [Candidatus Eremiobacteraeota bacterium]|nr:biopolymer transporter ExbD [Candidatus Eremiobacteraeota bacterium]
MAVSTGQGEEEVMSTINITPFTDVLLVLLIIFIILASVVKEPKLPDAKNRIKVHPSQIVVLVDEKNQVQIGSNIVNEMEAKKQFQELVRSTGSGLKTVIIKANPKASFGTILRVMDAAKAANLTTFGLANHIEGLPEGQTGG